MFWKSVADYLLRDITVEYLKEQESVKAYFEELISGGSGKRFEQMAHYLASPVAVHRRA